MGNCKDCICYEACKDSADMYDEGGFPYSDCQLFKPKSRFIELPCAVGDKVYWINRIKNKIETDIVVAIHLYGDGSLLITTETIGTKCGSTYSLNRFLEIMHFAKEEAEKALERSEGK